MPTHRANSKARAVLWQEKEKAEAVTPFRRTPALHATPLQAMLRQESVTLSRALHSTPLHSTTSTPFRLLSSTAQLRTPSAMFLLVTTAPDASAIFNIRHALHLSALFDSRPNCKNRTECPVGFPLKKRSAMVIIEKTHHDKI